MELGNKLIIMGAILILFSILLYNLVDEDREHINLPSIPHRTEKITSELITTQPPQLPEKIIIEKEQSIPEITYPEIFSLDKKSDVKICTQNFNGSELIVCLSFLAHAKMNISVCKDIENEQNELVCQKNFLHSVFMSQELPKTIHQAGINLTAICERLPLDNNQIGNNEKECFWLIGATGFDKSACDKTKLDKTSCLELYEINKGRINQT